MAVNDELISIEANHAVYLQRLASGLGNDAIPYIDSMHQRIEDRINREVGNNLTVNRRSKLLSDIDSIVNEELKAYTKGLSKSNVELGEYEAKFQAKTISSLYPSVETVAIGRSVIKTAANNTLIKLGDGSYTSYNRMLSSYTDFNAQQITDIVGQGFSTGMTTREITNQVMSEVDNRVVKTKKEAKMIARTGSTHYANQAKRVYFSEEPVVIGTQNISVMDSVTSEYCRGIDLRITLKTDPNYDRAFAPFHRGCRGSNSPVVNPDLVGEDDGGSRPENFRDADSGLLDPKTTSSRNIYYQGMKGIDAKSQDAILGPTLGKAFRKGIKDGTLTPETFARLTVNDAELRGLTLKEMIKKDNALSRILIEQNKGKSNYLGRLID
jgi:hypothetical protein